MAEVLEESPVVTTEAASRPDTTLPGGYSIFFLVVGVLAAIRISLGFVSLPESFLVPVNLILAVAFVAAPILAEFFCANSPWSAKSAIAFLVGGVATHAAFGYLTANTSGILSGFTNAIGQVGLATWCVGLGALLGINLKDKNLLIPVSIFGAAYDFYLVIAPAGAPAAGLTREIIKTAPKVFTSIAAQVPAVSSHAGTGKVEVGSYIGPADLVFLAAFFIIIFRFKMNARLTLAVIAPVLVLYMIVVLVSNIPLPALVPIGSCILIANWKHFNLNRDEWIATGFVALLCAAFLTWGLVRRNNAPAEQAEPLPKASGPTALESAAKPAPTASDQQKSSSPTATGSTPSPP
jgi:hypothetical protein